MQSIRSYQLENVIKNIGRWFTRIPLILLQLMALTASCILVVLCIYFLSRLIFPVLSQETSLCASVQTLFSKAPVPSSKTPAISNISAQQSGQPSSSTSSPDKQNDKKSAQSAIACVTDITSPHQSEIASPTDNNSTTTSASISALSIVVALVTLILSLAGSWLTNSQKKLDSALQKAERTNHREDQRLNLIELRLITQGELLAYFLDVHGSRNMATTIVTNLMPYMELLASSDAERRRTAKDKLSPYIGRGVRADLPETWRYTIELEHYLITFKLAKRGETYCNLFD